MKKVSSIFIIIMLVLVNAEAKSFRVHYTKHGDGRSITVQADSSSEARQSVEDLFPDGYVTGVSETRP